MVRRVTGVEQRRQRPPPRNALDPGAALGGRCGMLRSKENAVLAMTTKTLMSIEEYDALPGKEGVKYELNEGELITVSASPRLAHNRVRDRLGRRLAAFVEEDRLGEVTMETDFRLSEGVVRIPDVAFIRADRLPGIDPAQRIEG